MVGLFNCADMNSVKKDITAYHNEQVKQDLQPDDTDTTWDKFKEVLHNIMKKRIPQRTIRHNNKLPCVNTMPLCLAINIVVSSRLPLVGHCEGNKHCCLVTLAVSWPLCLAINIVALSVSWPLCLAINIVVSSRFPLVGHCAWQ